MENDGTLDPIDPSAKIAKLEKELSESQADFQALDARVAGLETTVSILTSQLTDTLTIVSDMAAERALKPAVAPEVTNLYNKVRAAFEHAGLEFEGIQPNSRRRG